MTERIIFLSHFRLLYDIVSTWSGSYVVFICWFLPWSSGQRETRSSWLTFNLVGIAIGSRSGADRSEVLRVESLFLGHSHAAGRPIHRIVWLRRIFVVIRSGRFDLDSRLFWTEISNCRIFTFRETRLTCVQEIIIFGGSRTINIQFLSFYSYGLSKYCLSFEWSHTSLFNWVLIHIILTRAWGIESIFWNHGWSHCFCKSWCGAISRSAQNWPSC